MRRRGQRARLALAAHGWPWLALLASLLGWVASALPAQAWLAFTAEGMQRGEIWRLWSGHLVHYGSAHFWGDWLAFVVWAVLVESESRRALLATLLLGAPLLLLALSFAYPTLREYRGLSGLDTALVIELILLRGFRRGVDGRRSIGSWLTRLLGTSTLRVVGGASLCALLAKLGYEFQVGHALLVHDLGLGVQLLPGAHAFGALVGLVLGLLFRLESGSNASPLTARAARVPVACTEVPNSSV
jgi:rhomboid family GlyGly-CTERM serine protease